MGTAVLFPQDCLRPRSRIKNQNHQVMIYPLESAPRSKRNRPASLQSSDSGLLPLPTPAQNPSPMGILRKGNDVKHIKTRKASEVKDINSPPRAAPDLPTYRILQRPKQGESATELLAHFSTLDKSGLLEEVRGPQVGASVDADRYWDMTVAQNGSLGKLVDALKMKGKSSHGRKAKDSGRFVDGSHVSSADCFKHTTVKVKLKNAVEEKLPSGFAAVKPGEGQDTLLSTSLTRLRRTTTEPSIASHILGQYTRRVMHISFNNPKLDVHFHGDQFCGVDLSCEERWAGPAYSASPPPSSLPLPKLCLPHAKVTSLELAPLAKQYSTSVYTQSFLESSAPTSKAPGNGGAWDAAFATKNLRRLLNLDPC